MDETMNKVELNGFVGMDPVVKTLNDGTKVARFSLATSHNFKNAAGQWVRDTTWHQIVAWDRFAGMAETDIRKGSHVTLTGRLAQRKYTDKNGIAHTITEVVARSLDIVSEA